MIVHPPELPHAAGGYYRCSTGSSTTKVVAWSGRDSTQTRPPLASTNPRTIARPEAGAAVAGGVGAGAVEGFEDPVLLGLRDARARGRRRARGCGRRRRARGRRPGWPPEWRWAFSSRFANARSSCAASARTGGRSPSTDDLERALRARPRSAAPMHLLDRRPLRAAARPRGPPAARGPAGCRSGARAACASARIAAASSSRSVGVQPQRLGGGHDRRQGRAQVVGDRAQQRGLDHVASAAARPFRRRRSSARRAPAPPRAATQAKARSAPGCAAAPAPGRRRSACRSGARPRAAGRCPATARDDDRRARQVERAREPLGDRGQRLLQPPAAQQQPGHLRREIGLLAALLGLDRPAAARPRSRTTSARRPGRTRRARPSSRRRRS